jgi:hypothetical protein
MQVQGPDAGLRKNIADVGVVLFFAARLVASSGAFNGR